MSVTKVQMALKARGFDPGPVDGIMGPKTEAAIVAFKRAVGLRARPFVGPITMRALGLFVNTVDEEPWMNEMAKHVGLHERRDFTRLYAWLRSDGHTLGDPRKLPWCGDAVDTALRLTLPDEPRPLYLGRNLYLARNWLMFGEECGPCFGAVVVFWRGSREGNSGHVGFAVAIDEERGRIKVRGGNQSNMVSDAWLGLDRLLGYRWPTTYKGNARPLPGLSSSGATISENEA